MSIAALIRRMTEAGATPEAIALAVEAIEALQSKDEERKRKQRERTAKHREVSRDSNVTVTVTSRDKAELAPPSPDGPSSLPHTPTQHPLNPPSTPDKTQGAGGEVVVAFPKTKDPSQSRGTRLPADWEPSPDLIAFARQEGLTDEQISRELARFRDYWLQATGQRATKRDWDATFRNWIREAADRQRRFSRPSSSGNGTSAGSRFAAMQRAVARVSDQELFPE